MCSYVVVLRVVSSVCSDDSLLTIIVIPTFSHFSHPVPHTPTPCNDQGAAPFRFKEWEAEKKVPVLFMDVNLGFGKNGRIGIHEGDSPPNLAANFGKTYNLDISRIGKLTELIRHHMSENGVGAAL